MKIRDKKGDAIFRAIEFAARAHTGHYRKGTRIPYLIHPLSVGKILINHGCSVNMVIAGILHDTVEDTSVSIKDIENNFGKSVARIVRYVSEMDPSNTWKDRKSRTIEHIRTRNPMNVLIVECADKLDNIRAIKIDYAKLGDKLWKRFNRPKSDQKWYYKSLVQAFMAQPKGEPSRSLFIEFAAEVKNVFG